MQDNMTHAPDRMTDARLNLSGGLFVNNGLIMKLVQKQKGNTK